MKLTYDGHGLNDADDKYARRVITWARTHADNGGGYVLERTERDKLGPVLAAAPYLLSALEAIVKITGGSQPIDYPGALMVARAAIAKSKGE